MLSTLAAATLEKLLNQSLQFDPETQQRLCALNGKVIGIAMHGTNIEFFLIPMQHNVRIQSRFDAAPDTSLSSTLLTLASPSQWLIKGDEKLGTEVQTILEAMDIDWEEQLSHWVGDIAAHQAGNFIRSMSRWGAKSSKILAQDVVEYLQQESRDLIDKEEFTELNAALSTLHDDVEKLGQRITALASSREN